MTEQVHAGNARRDGKERLVKGLFAAMALLFLLAGIALYVLQTRLRIDADTARLIATVFLATAIADGLVLYNWDRMFKRRG
jgi:hypothetical protein